MEAYQGLEEIEICIKHQIKSLSEVEQMFQSCLPSLRSLKMGGCNNLKSVRGGLKHLIAWESQHVYMN